MGIELVMTFLKKALPRILEAMKKAGIGGVLIEESML